MIKHKMKIGQGAIMMLTLPFPWWVPVVILFIIFSGYMAFRAMQAEKRLEQHYIEQEGHVYMERLKQERARRGQ